MPGSFPLILSKSTSEEDTTKMRNHLVKLCLGVLVGGIALALPAQAATVFVNADITTSTTWTADDEFILTEVIYVTNGATLTIEPGTVIRGEMESADGANDPGTLVITRGAKLFALGTENDPIVFTDLVDDNVGDATGTPPYDTATNAIGLTAQWGGLIMLGRTYVANDTANGPDASREVQIEGLVPDARGLYGNCAADLNVFPNCDDDDSGIARYVSVRYAGFNLSDANEINGITLGAVGRETDLSYLEVYQNNDDGFEFFGGTANLDHFIVVSAGDDSIDLDEGYRGKGQFGLVVQGILGQNVSDKVGEWDGANNPNRSQPYGLPAFYNLTMVGLGQATADNTALHIRDNMGSRLYNSLMLDFGGAIAIVEGDPTDDDTPGARAVTPMTAGECTGAGDPPTFCNTDADCGVGTCEFFFNALDSVNQLEFTNNTAWCIGQGGSFPSDSTASSNLGGDSNDAYGDADGFTPFGGSNTDGNVVLGCADALPIGGLSRIEAGAIDPVIAIDPLPSTNTLKNGARAVPADGFLVDAPYRGAFLNDNWATKWSTMDRLGYFPADDAVRTVRVEEDITASTTWTADAEYILTEVIYVTDGATLTIEPGTVIRGEMESADGANDPGTLVVTRGSKIFSLGTADAPVVFTDLLDDNVKGNPGTAPYDTATNAIGLTAQWGGLIVLGRTYVANDTAAGPDAAREVQIEGLVPDARGLYGNCAADGNVFPNCDDDDSGIIRYTSVRYGGFNLSDANEINGITMGAVGRETNVSFIEVFQNNDDGIELFGGTVNFNFFLIVNAGDDSIDLDEGYRGMGQFGLVVQGILGANVSDKVGEWDGANNPNRSQPYGLPAFYNLTVVGLGQDSADNTALHIRDNMGSRLYNSLMLDFGGAIAIVEGDPTDDDTPGARAVTPMTVGECTGAGDPPTFCNTDADCGAGTCEPFFNALDSTNQLEFSNNTAWCIGQGGAFPSDAGASSALGGDSNDAYGEADGFTPFTNPGASANTVLGCGDALPITAINRVEAGTIDPVVFIDPLPTAATLGQSSRTVPTAGFLKPAPYRGAFATDNWASGWSTMSALGMIPTTGEEILVSNDITSSQTWTSDNVYVLDQPIYITDGSTLTVEAGTVIRGQSESADGANDPGTLIVTRGSKIQMNGTADDPIVMTDLLDDNIGDNAGTARLTTTSSTRRV